MSYTITDDHGVESCETMADLFDGLIMRGVNAVEAVANIGKLVAADLERQEGS